MADKVPGLEAPSTGAMVALMPSKESAALFAESDGIPAEESHLTLRFLGRAKEMKLSQEAVAKALIPVATTTPKMLVGMDWQIAHFGHKEIRDAGYVAVVATWPHDDETLNLIKAHDDVGEALDAVGAEDKSSFKNQSWKPHITLGYYPIEEAEERFPEGSGWKHDPVFDRIIVKYADEVMTLPLASDS